jgi:hypothetical protein
MPNVRTTSGHTQHGLLPFKRFTLQLIHLIIVLEFHYHRLFETSRASCATVSIFTSTRYSFMYFYLQSEPFRRYFKPAQIGNVEMTEQEIEEFREVFELVDKDKGGAIEADEVRVNRL